jgi:hypothetical protein
LIFLPSSAGSKLDFIADEAEPTKASILEVKPQMVVSNVLFKPFNIPATVLASFSEQTIFILEKYTNMPRRLIPTYDHIEI